jgi:hypothetical protein
MLLVMDGMYMHFTFMYVLCNILFTKTASRLSSISSEKFLLFLHEHAVIHKFSTIFPLSESGTWSSFLFALLATYEDHVSANYWNILEY